MISTPFEYSRATSLDDALAKLGATNGEGKFIAGGHSLVPLMKLRLSEPKILIDIARIPGLSGIREKDAKIEIGAGTVHHVVPVAPVSPVPSTRFGPRMPNGSKTCLIARISSRAAGSAISRKYGIFSVPRPCSPEMAPPASTATRNISG